MPHVIPLQQPPERRPLPERVGRVVRQEELGRVRGEGHVHDDVGELPSHEMTIAARTTKPTACSQLGLFEVLL